ncbi:hypothetical protein KJZ67_02990 [Patescibacteria group bacterium]|nr:hypothetical protein [Patescibacteria group bacterium]
MDHQSKTRNPLLLFAGLTGIIVLSAYINILSPDSPFALAGFFVLVTFSIGTLCAYLLQNTRRATLIASSISVYLILRLLGLRHPLYALLLVASIVALEFLWRDNS